MLQQDVAGMWTGGAGKLMVGGAVSFLVRSGLYKYRLYSYEYKFYFYELRFYSYAQRLYL